MTPTQQLATDGYLITQKLLSDVDLASIDMQLRHLPQEIAGQRNLLRQNWCAALAHQLCTHPQLAGLLPPNPVAVQCTYFQKSYEGNWLVPMHQDLSIPVAERVMHPELATWSYKDEQLNVQPPAALLEQLLAIRLHLDPCGENDGALRLIPGTHRTGKLDANAISSARGKRAETTCVVAAGAVLAMYPLLLHASSKAIGTSRRRVLHFLYGPAALPYGLRWPVSALT